MYVERMGKTVDYFSCGSPLDCLGNRLLKRAFDFVCSLVFLCTLFPVLVIIVAIMTESTMPGRLFFVQKRTGWRGRTFRCIKFRTMRASADADTRQATRTDARITKWGHIMRKTNLDEMPQFLNVLMGDMSIVGPRPHMVKHTDEYRKLIDKYMVRHMIKPGITGLAQVSGYRGQTEELWQMEKRVEYDVKYIESWTLSLDIKIIVRTIINAVKGEKNAF